MQWRNWLIHRLGGTPPGPVDVKSLEANDWLSKNAPDYVNDAIRHVSTLLRKQNDRIFVLEGEIYHLRRQAMHVSYVSPDFPNPAA